MAFIVGGTVSISAHFESIVEVAVKVLPLAVLCEHRSHWRGLELSVLKYAHIVHGARVSITGVFSAKPRFVEIAIVTRLIGVHDMIERAYRVGGLVYEV